MARLVKSFIGGIASKVTGASDIYETDEEDNREEERDLLILNKKRREKRRRKEMKKKKREMNLMKVGKSKKCFLAVKTMKMIRHSGGAHLREWPLSQSGQITSQDGRTDTL